MITREVDFCNAATKEERNNSSDVKVNLPSSKTAVFSSSSTRPTTSSLSSWTRLKDPRIVRVSRAFGGKDRHSKVCTVRGLRDRRVRLSVPTAIQLYDLQERLGLSQPSKVVDWLLDVAKHDIDQLPPLQFPPRIFDPFLHPFPAPPPPSNAAPPTGSANERWDPLTHNGVIGSVQKPEEHYLHNFNNVVLSPSLPLQQYSFFHPTASASPPEFDLKNMINFQMLMSSSSQHAPPQSHSINHHSMVVKPMHFLHSHHEPDKNINNEE